MPIKLAPRLTDRLRSKVSLLFMISGVIIALVFGSVLTYAWISKGRQAENCRAALRVRDAVVFVVVDARATSRRSGRATPASEKFYGRALSRLAKADCLPH